jgi:hypothetical protein
MRKFYLFATACVFSMAVSAQTTVFFDDFEGNSLEGYTLHNLDGLVPDDGDLATMEDSAWTIRSIGAQGWTFNRSAFSVSWYVNDEGPSDDWLVTPAITIAGDAVLEWNGLAITSSGNFRDRYQVFVSNGSDLTSLEEATLVFDTGAEGELITPQSRSVNLATEGFANQTIYIAFRNFTQPFGSNPGGPGNGGNELAIDNIKVTDNSTSNTTNNEGPLKGLTLLPNPSYGSNMKLQFTAEKAAQVNMQIVDITGKVQMLRNLGTLAAGAHLIDVERGTLANGIYFISLRSEEGATVVKAILN